MIMATRIFNKDPSAVISGSLPQSMSLNASFKFDARELGFREVGRSDSAGCAGWGGWGGCCESKEPLAAALFKPETAGSTERDSEP